MKKFWFISIFLIAVLSIVAVAQVRTTISLGPDVRVSFASQDPDPAEPGQYVDVRFKVENNGSQAVKDFVFELLPEFPFSLDPGISAVEKLGALHSRQFGESAVIIKRRVRIDEDAVEGKNELKFRYKFDNDVWIERDPILIDIRTHDAILSVDSVSVDKNALEPGSSSTLNIKISNQADSVLKDIKVSLDIRGTPFIPLGSTNEKSVYKIDKKEAFDFRFNLLADPEAESGAYNIPLKIVYSDELGKIYLKNSTIGLIINAKPDLSITLDESEIFEEGKSGEIVVKVVNKGVTDVKFMNIKLMPRDDYRILSNNEVYLGNIDSDDFETADFNLFAEKTNKKEMKLPLIVEYKDANNNNYKESIELKLNLYSSSEAKKLGLREKNKFTSIVIAVVIAAVAFFYYRRHKKNKKKV